MSLSEARKKANKKWNDENLKEKYDRIQVVVPKGEKEKIQAHAQSLEKSVNSFINEAIQEKISRDTDTAPTPTTKKESPSIKEEPNPSTFVFDETKPNRTMPFHELCGFESEEEMEAYRAKNSTSKDTLSKMPMWERLGFDSEEEFIAQKEKVRKEREDEQHTEPNQKSESPFPFKRKIIRTANADSNKEKD